MKKLKNIKDIEGTYFYTFLTSSIDIRKTLKQLGTNGYYLTTIVKNYINSTQKLRPSFVMIGRGTRDVYISYSSKYEHYNPLEQTTWNAVNEVLNNKMNKIIIDGKEIELSDETVREIKNKLNLGIDYRKFIGKFDHTLAIKGSDLLKSFKDNRINIVYNNDYVGRYTEKINYEEVNQDQLKVGDVVCTTPEKTEKDLILSNFGIFIDKGVNGLNRFQCLDSWSGIEYITSVVINRNKKVIRFLRK